MCRESDSVLRLGLRRRGRRDKAAVTEDSTRPSLVPFLGGRTVPCGIHARVAAPTAWAFGPCAVVEVEGPLHGVKRLSRCPSLRMPLAQHQRLSTKEGVASTPTLRGFFRRGMHSGQEGRLLVQARNGRAGGRPPSVRLDIKLESRAIEDPWRGAEKGDPVANLHGDALRPHQAACLKCRPITGPDP